MVTTCRCGARWSGHKLEHCTECHKTFTSTRAGDMHRTGDHAVSVGPNRRRCLTTEEMLAKGLRPRFLTNGTEVWGRKGPESPEVAATYRTRKPE